MKRDLMLQAEDVPSIYLVILTWVERHKEPLNGIRVSFMQAEDSASPKACGDSIKNTLLLHRHIWN
jgi:hypothetical protein